MSGDFGAGVSDAEALTVPATPPGLGDHVLTGGACGFVSTCPVPRPAGVRPALANVFRKKPESKPFRFLRPHDLCSNYSAVPLARGGRHTQRVNARAWLRPAELRLRGRPAGVRSGDQIPEVGHPRRLLPFSVTGCATVFNPPVCQVPHLRNGSMIPPNHPHRCDPPTRWL